MGTSVSATIVSLCSLGNAWKTPACQTCQTALELLDHACLSARMLICTVVFVTCTSSCLICLVPNWCTTGRYGRVLHLDLRHEFVCFRMVTKFLCRNIDQVHAL